MVYPARTAAFPSPEMKWKGISTAATPILSSACSVLHIVQGAPITALLAVGFYPETALDDLHRGLF